MKRKQTQIVLLLTLIVGSTLAYAQDSVGPRPKKVRTPEDYEQRTLKQLASKGSGVERRADKNETVILYGHTLPSRMRVTSRGSARPLPQIKKDLLLKWANRYAGFVEGYTQRYKTEILFIEKGTKYWLAVRNESLPELQEAVKLGRLVELFLIRVGTARISGKWEPLLLVESFQKPL